MTDRPISAIKNDICSAIINCNEIVDALDADVLDGDLMYTHIFPTPRRPGTEAEKRTFICMKVNTFASRGSNTQKRINFVLYVVTHDDLQNVSSGVAAGCTRIDYIADQLEIVFDKAQMGFGDVRVLSNEEDQVDARHPMRVIACETTGVRSSVCP